MRIAVVLAIVAGCREPSNQMLPDASTIDAAGKCASSFGSELTNNFGRIDGTVIAVVEPNDQKCAQPNATHVVVQVLMHGAAYRMVTNVDVLTAEADAPLTGPAWEEGWHIDAPLDYVSDLHKAAADFTLDDPVAHVMRIVKPGDHISVYATSSGGLLADSAHLVHRNGNSTDGAIVITPDTTPHYLLFRFTNQGF